MLILILASGSLKNVPEVVRIQDEVAQLTGRRSGTVTIDLSFVAHAGLLPMVIGAFRRCEPNVRLEIKEGLFDVLEAGIYNGTTMSRNI